MAGVFCLHFHKAELVTTNIVTISGLFSTHLVIIFILPV